MALYRLKEVTAPEGSLTAGLCALVVFAHPDDEVIAIGGRMGRFGTSHFVDMTDGASRNEQYSRAYGIRRSYGCRRACRHELQFAELTRRIACEIAERRDFPNWLRRRSNGSERFRAASRQIQQESER